MGQNEVRDQWEGTAPGWAKWEDRIADWMEPATDLMLEMAGVSSGNRIIDLACGAGSQTLRAARKVGPGGHVLACDIANTMLEFVQKNAHAVGLKNVSTLNTSAEDLRVEPHSFDAAICRLGLMLFSSPTKALAGMKGALKPGCRAAVVVFSVPQKNFFMSGTMQILLRHAGKQPPAPGKPGIFALSAPGKVQQLFRENGFVDYREQIVPVTLKTASPDETLVMMKEAFGAYRAVLSDCSDQVKHAAWEEVSKTLQQLKTSNGFEASTEVIVASAANPR